jgi:2-oxoglutarate/2-oxoacid ferredoxin oxidoreductase subunit beta
MVAISDYIGLKPAWCPGCGNFGILKALNNALVALNIEPWQLLLVSGIGQAGKLPHYTRANVFNSLHGRPLSPAIGARIANRDLKVIAISGDGDGYGEGGNHFIHAARRNHEITYLVHNNQVYGLTKGQASPTSDSGYVTKTTPYGAAPPVNPVLLAIAAGATFVGRGFAGDVEGLTDLLKKGITHNGFALIDILQPCVSFNHQNTFEWYRKKVYNLSDVTNFDSGDKAAALVKAQEWGEKIPIGVIYQTRLPTYEEQQPVLSGGPLVNWKLDSGHVETLFKEFF